jgi:hypothetical protein
LHQKLHFNLDCKRSASQYTHRYLAMNLNTNLGYIKGFFKKQAPIIDL